jgi:hypothetical protein
VLVCVRVAYLREQHPEELKESQGSRRDSGTGGFFLFQQSAARRRQTDGTSEPELAFVDFCGLSPPRLARDIQGAC